MCRFDTSDMSSCYSTQSSGTHDWSVHSFALRCLCKVKYTKVWIHAAHNHNKIYLWTYSSRFNNFTYFITKSLRLTDRQTETDIQAERQRQADQQTERLNQFDWVYKSICWGIVSLYIGLEIVSKSVQHTQADLVFMLVLQ